MTDEIIMGYCMKEKTQKPMKDAKQVTLKNGKMALQGVCSSCGTKMTKFISAKKAAPAVDAAPAPAPTPTSTDPSAPSEP